MIHFQTWQRYAPLGLALIGLGASLLGHSIEIKVEGAATLSWFLWGTVSLAVLNAGVAVFGEAVKHRAIYDAKKEEGSSIAS